MFYISSRGSTATVWIGKALSKHPKIVCFHGTRSFPPVLTGSTFPANLEKNIYDEKFYHQETKKAWIKEISAEKYIEGLVHCSTNTHDEKIFGSIHGYHGLLAKEPCERFNGLFSYITRHPISRIHSVMLFTISKKYYKFSTFPENLDNSDLHSRVNTLLKDVDLMEMVSEIENRVANKKKLANIFNNKVKKILPQILYETLKEKKTNFLIRMNNKKNSNNEPDEKIYLSKLFISLLDDFFSYEQELYDGCSKDCGIKMEEVVQSSEHFKNTLFKKIAPNIDVSDEYLKSVFSGGRFNIHRKNPITYKEIWEGWPKKYERCFCILF